MPSLFFWNEIFFVEPVWNEQQFALESGAEVWAERAKGSGEFASLLGPKSSAAGFR